MQHEEKTFRFMQRLAFGPNADGSLPTDPVAWAEAQLDRVPPIDLLDAAGQVRTDLPPEFKLTRTMTELMTAYRRSWNAVDKMFRLSPDLPEAERKATVRKALYYPYRDLEHWKELQARASTALFSKQPVFERFWHFWTNHFMVAPNTDNNDVLVGPYQRALREHLTGSFRDLLWNAVTHPSMLIYLDNYRNVGPNSTARKQGRTTDSINENLGRELLELFTVTPQSGYTQADVEQSTLILTGWTFVMPNSDEAKPLFFPNHNAPAALNGTIFVYGRHESADQKVMGKVYSSSVFRQKGKLEDFITDLANHPATAHHIARKLCVYFMDDEPPAEAVALVEKAFIDSKGHLPAVHKAVIEATWNNMERTKKFQNPEAWLLQTLRLLGLGLPQNPPQLVPMKEWTTATLMKDLGQPLPFSPQPNGWPIRSDDWISKEMLDRRLRLAQMLAQRVPMASAEQMGRLEKLMATSLPAQSKSRLLVTQALAQKNPSQAVLMWLASPDMLWS
jgi:uncharacterized protein (DUF1800 family)